MMAAIEIASQLQPILNQVEGQTLDQKVARLLARQMRDHLEECEREMLDLEIKYHTDYESFKHRLEAGELGDPFSYGLEQDTMHWDDLRAEKQYWLAQLIEVERFLE